MGERVARSAVVLAAVVVLTVVSLVGAVISVQSDLAPGYADALGPKGRLSIPWPMSVFQLLMAAAAGSSRRWLALVGSGLVAVTLLLGVVSGFFDGGYADDRLTGAQRAFQVAFICGLVVVGLIAARRFGQVLRARTA